ncbi:hypothetical protein D3C87_988380 [compost metagenome]
MTSGPCAKQTVTCTIAAVTGEQFVGTNWCRNPQEKCPRLPGEGYEKCVSVCGQDGHAELDALAKAGSSAIGATATIAGHTYACQHCQEALFAAGVLNLRVKP